MAWKSPVKCRLMSSIGKIWLYPPPVAPPFMPNTGPSDGSRKARQVFAPTRFIPSASPMLTVVFPSPAAVGLIAVTSTNFAPLFGCGLAATLALYLPYSSSSSSPMPILAAISVMGLSLQLRAISISVTVHLSLSIIFFPFVTRSKTTIVCLPDCLLCRYASIN